MQFRLHVLLATVGALVTLTSPAHADLQLILKSGATTVVVNDGGAGDVNSAAGQITFIGHVGGWNITAASGSEGFNHTLDMNSLATASAGAAPLTLQLSATNINPTDGLWNTSIGGTLGGKHSLTYAVYANTNNQLQGMQTQLGSTMSFNNPGSVSAPFGGSDSGTFTDLNPFSATQVVTITAGAPGSTSFNGALDLGEVPEPGAVTLLGCFLLSAFGIFRWKLGRLSRLNS